MGFGSVAVKRWIASLLALETHEAERERKTELYSLSATRRVVLCRCDHLIVSTLLSHLARSLGPVFRGASCRW